MTSVSRIASAPCCWNFLSTLVANPTLGFTSLLFSLYSRSFKQSGPRNSTPCHHEDHDQGGGGRALQVSTPYLSGVHNRKKQEEHAQPGAMKMLTSRQCHAQGRHWRGSRWPRSGRIGCLACLCEVSSFPQSHLAFSHLLDHLRRHFFCHYRSRFLLATFRSHTPTRTRLPRRASIVTGTD